MAAAVASLLLAAAAGGNMSITPDAAVSFDATIPWVLHSASHNAVSAEWETEAEARTYAPWRLGGSCALRYLGELPRPPAMDLLSTGLGGMNPATAQAVHLDAGANVLRDIELQQVDLECHDKEQRRWCWWFGQLTLHLRRTEVFPDGGVMSRLECDRLEVCSASREGECFPCIQTRDHPGLHGRCRHPHRNASSSA